MDRPIIPAPPGMRAATAQALADARALLPWAGPLQNFVHRSMLPAQIGQPFAAAMARAHAAFGAAPSMSLAFYRAAYHRGRAARGYDVRKGTAPTLAQETRILAGTLWHAARHGCVAGLVPVARITGRMRQALVTG